MRKNIIQKLISKYLISEKLEKNKRIVLKPIQFLLNDSTSVMICLKFEQLSLGRAQVKTPVIYVTITYYKPEKKMLRTCVI